MKSILKRFLLAASCLYISMQAGYAQGSMFVNPSLLHHPRMDNAAYREECMSMVAVLDSFFASKNRSLAHNDHWLPDDFKQYKYPYRELYQVELSHRLQDSLHFRPTLLELIPAEEEHAYLAKLAYMGKEADGFSSLRFICNIRVTKNEGRFYLSRATQYYTRQWKQYTQGSIRFVVSPGRSYNETEAQRLDSFNTGCAAFLKVPVKSMTYYSCVNSEELFRLKGFDYLPNMYFAATGGQADADARLIYAAINSEWYPHELTHIYVNKLPANAGGYLATEGLCTFLGGSLNIPLRQHARAIQTYITRNPETALYPLLFREQQITEHTSSIYTLGGLIAAATYARHGLPGLMDWLRVTDNEASVRAFFKEKFKISSTEAIEQWLRRELNK